MIATIRQAKSGDLHAFGDLYELSYERVYRFLFYRVLDTSATEDLISDVYTKAMKNISKLRGESEGEFYSWILQIAYTTFIDSTRRIDITENLDDITWEPSYAPDVSGQIDATDELRQVLSYMDTLPERDRHIVMMRIWDELSYDEISHITGLSVANSKKIVSRTLEKIAANVQHFTVFALLITHVFTR